MQKSTFSSCVAVCAATSLFHTSLTAEPEPVYLLEDYTVSAGPTARAIDDFATPFSAMDETDIQRSQAGTLGELLNGEPGVTSSSFGGGASRPIIRGFDGPRVRIMESGLGSMDVSATSPDHATTVEPLLTQRVEVLRGPSTLLYGSSAIGGVVNVVGRNIPREQPDRQLSGAAEARYDSVSEGETYLGYGTFSEGPLVITLQGLKRNNDDYEIPGKAEIHHEEDEHDHDEHDEHGDHGDHDEHEEEEGHNGDTLESSFVENEFYSIGASWFFNERNYLGFSVSGYDAFYGVPGHEHAHGDEHEDEGHGHEDEDHGGHDEHGDEDHHDHGEEGVAIDMERTRLDTELALFDPMQWIEAVRVRFGYTDYKHEELEEGGAAATFERDGWELRAEAGHYDWAIFDEGVFGIQLSDTDFEATGEEIEGENPGDFAFGPPSTTRNQAVFISEHIHGEQLHFDLGGRIERQTIAITGEDYSDVATSLSVGAIWVLDDANSIQLTLQRTQRHPTATELYANGPHLATSSFEVGDPDLGLETAYGADLSFRHKQGKWDAVASVFYTHFDDYIFAEDSGLENDELPVLDYTAVESLFYGFELEVDYLLYQSADTSFEVGLLADYVQAENQDKGTDLPRIPPFRVGGKAELSHGNWNAGLLLRHSFAQNDTAPTETDTDSFTELEAEVGYVFELNNRSRLTLFARANNLLDEEIRQHTSFIKDRAPRPGRNFTLGARVEF